MDEENEEKVGDENRNQPDGGFSGAHSVAEEAREEHRTDEEIGGTDESDISDGDGEIVDSGAPNTGYAEAKIADDFGVFCGNFGLRGERREDQEGIESGKEDRDGEKHIFLPDEDADQDAESKGPEEHAELHAVPEEESRERRERLDLAKENKSAGVEKNSSEEKYPCGLGFPLVGCADKEGGEGDNDEDCGRRDTGDEGGRWRKSDGCEGEPHDEEESGGTEEERKGILGAPKGFFGEFS